MANIEIITCFCIVWAISFFIAEMQATLTSIVRRENEKKYKALSYDKEKKTLKNYSFLERYRILPMQKNQTAVNVMLEMINPVELDILVP